MNPEPITPATESSEDFDAACSPLVIRDQPERRAAVQHIVTDAARHRLLDAEGISYACDKALRALREGATAHRAILAGEAAVERYVELKEGKQ